MEANGRHFAGDISKLIYFGDFFFYFGYNFTKIAPKGPVDSTPAFVQITAWRQRHWDSITCDASMFNSASMSWLNYMWPWSMYFTVISYEGHGDFTHSGWDKMAAIFPGDTFKRISLNENVSLSIKISHWILFLGDYFTINQHLFR